MVAVDMVVAAVLLDCCSLAQGAPERAPAFWLEVTSELPAGLSWPSGGRLLLEPSGGGGVGGGWFEGPMGYLDQIRLLDHAAQPYWGY